jgi:hypothetical protein
MANIDRRPSENVLRQKIQNRWVDLNNDDLAYIDASRDRLIERLKVRYYMTGEQAQKQVSKWERNLMMPQNRAPLRRRSGPR